MTAPRFTSFGVFRALCCLASFATAATAATFNIPAQSTPAALELFIQQSGTKVVYPHDDLKNTQSSPVVGDFEAAPALNLLLTNTGFTARQTKAKQFVVSAAGTKTGSVDGEVRDETGRPLANARVELDGTDKAVLTDKRGHFAFPDVAPGLRALNITADGFKKTRVTDVNVRGGNSLSLSPIVIPVQAAGVLQLETYSVSAKKNDGALELDPYQVSGAKAQPFVTGNMDIPRTINDVQPYYIFDSKTIDSSGTTNVAEFLNQRLTMNATAQTSAQSISESLPDRQAGNTSSFNLRGIGADKTLVLINGRRAAGTMIGSSPTGQPDVNGIPMSAIDRIEVLPSSASGIYGGSALGGVINIILKKNFTGGEIYGTYDNTTQSDSPKRTAGFNYGASFFGGKTRIRISGQYSDASPLLLQDRRALFSRGYYQIYRLVPNFFSNTASPLGAVPNITNSVSTPVPGQVNNFAPLVLKDGRTLPAGITYISPGTTASTTTAALSNQLLANAGSWNFDLPASNQSTNGLLRRLTATPKTKSISGSLAQQILPWLDLTIDASHSENDATYSNAFTPVPRSFAVAANNIYNPFTTQVTVVMPVNVDSKYISHVASDSVNLALIAKLPHNWTGEMDYSWSRTRQKATSNVFDSTAFRADVTNSVFNPFVDAIANPPGFEKYLGQLDQTNATRLDDAALRASGPLFELPWGTPNLTLGVEHQHVFNPAGSIHNFNIFPFTTSSNFFAYTYPFSQLINSGYGETLIPLVKQDWLPGVHRLELQLTQRVDRYSVRTGTANYSVNPVTGAISYSGPLKGGQPYFDQTKYQSNNNTVGLFYQPIKELTLRASIASAFLPPTPDQFAVNPSAQISTTTVNDPTKANAAFLVQIQALGNPALTPQNSKSWNGGIIWEPSWDALKGFRFDAEYYKIEQHNYISSLTPQQLVSNESLFPGRVTRDASGTITFIDTSLLNLFNRETEGWDFTVNYEKKTGLGTFTVNAAESVILHIKDQYSLTLPAYDSVGYPSEGGAAKYKSNGTLIWERGPIAAGWTVRYYSDYRQNSTPGGPNYTRTVAAGQAPPSQSASIVEGGDTIPSQTYHDFFVRYAFGQNSRGKSEKGSWSSRLLSDLTVQVGVHNVFDRWPPFDPSYNFFISPYGDLRLRSYWINVKKAF